ncbi:putative glycosyltransferase WbpX, putative [Methylophaga frappieri]|uniref:Putative glycosyltransferase WbpX, putative n=1 Tax=Methylophaga frappieri (strain ATCC BAA-2434 / DSM 25690 / JAM7) TaxID=754477 RepID=I1YKI9_METFJ|nr:glycosyltransferase family 1 protein [Methylophaga frappieri]AFJ03432.1 putative glycosyltransferase WbpX, putative [Methylophaga frappieri]
MSQPVIWVNITTSYHWQRAAVGIVRVESELASHLPSVFSDAKVKYCIWDNDRFVEVTQRKHPQKQAKPVTPTAAPQAYRSPLSKRDALKHIAAGFLALLPGRWQPFVRRSLIRMNQLRHRVIQRWQQWRAMKAKPAPTRPAKAKTDPKPTSTIFAPGEVLITVGLDWNYPYRPELRKLKAQQGLRIVSCCYDLIPVYYPQYCVGDVASVFSEYFLDMARLSDLIMCISEQTRQDLRSHLLDAGAPLPPAEVFRLGDDSVAETVDKPLDDEIATIMAAPYILFVSTIERRKNHQVLYLAYHLLAKAGHINDIPQMVWVGMPGWGTSELLEDVRLDPLLKGKITLCHHVSDAALAALYQQATLTVFPSYYEGWGLPVAESLAHGTPVISSDRGSLPEVGGDWVQYCDPMTPQAWANAILHWSRNPAALQDWRDQLRAAYRPQPWSAAITEIATSIQAILAQPAISHTGYAGYDMTCLAGYQAGSTIISEQPANPLCRSRAYRLAPGGYQLTIWADATTQQNLSVRLISDDLVLLEENLPWDKETSEQSCRFQVDSTAMVQLLIGHDGPALTCRQFRFEPVTD